MQKIAEDQGYDNIIFGSCSLENESYVISMNVYDLATNKISYSGSTTVESIFDTFDAIDQIIEKTIEGFSGIHVTYGNLKLIPPKTSEPYTFTIDDVALPDGTYSINKIPSGVHKVTITQQRPFGEHIAIHDIIVEEGIRNNIPMPITYLTTDELNILSEADRYFTLASISGVTDQIPESLSKVTSSNFFKEYRPQIIEKYTKWNQRINEDLQSTIINKNSAISRKFRTRWYKENIDLVYTENVSLSEQHFRGDNRGEYGDEIHIIPDFKTIYIDGKADDWNDVTSEVKDGSNDSDISLLGSIEGSDLISAKYAIDSKYLYIMMESKDKLYKIDNIVHHVVIRGKKETNIGFLLSNNEWYAGKSALDGGNYADWESMRSQVKKKAGEIFEVAIPLSLLLTKAFYTTPLESDLALYYHDGKEAWELIDEFSWMPDFLYLPVVELMIRKYESVK